MAQKREKTKVEYVERVILAKIQAEREKNEGNRPR